MDDVVEAVLETPLPSYAVGVGTGYAASKLQHASNRYRDGDGLLGNEGVRAAGAVALEEVFGTDAAAFTGYVTGAALAERRRGDGSEPDEEEPSGFEQIREFLGP